ncbi:hypothetical protein [Actinoplanes sp. NPDC049118]|uniref:hypothetical protein n=1 Tax=Actinoplanes sp. NPDC049118 TaxID=3155769 RepID=UPI0033DEDEC6
MKVLLDEPRVFVTYGSATVVSGDDTDGNGYEHDEAWADESNGLCGAGVRGVLVLTTGTHTGWIPFRVELHEAEPEVDDSWDEIVEASFGKQAAYWHRARRTLTEPEQQDDRQAEAEELARSARERWGERVPNERLRATLHQGLALDAISRLDPDLEFALADADDATHRQVAAWAALRSLERAGLIGLPQIAPAVAALRRGQRAPAPFDDSAHVWAVLRQANPPHTSVPVPPDGEYEESPQNWAMTTLFHTAEEDSLAAVLEVLVCMAFVYGRDGYRHAFAAVREQFPQLA